MAVLSYAAPADGSERIQTTSDAKRESVQSAVAAPLRDVNVLRTKIPTVLLEAMADPYQRPAHASCAALAAAIVPLNGALGADLDEPATSEDDLMERGKGAALGAMAGFASDVIPFRGWVRKLSGAERHDSLVTAAITAGGVRRADRAIRLHLRARHGAAGRALVPQVPGADEVRQPGEGRADHDPEAVHPQPEG